ncbi:hypothetical protein BH11ARM2_BH11ARM2_14000 [soil metagenome]
MRSIHERPDWPVFTFDAEALRAPLEKVAFGWCLARSEGVLAGSESGMTNKEWAKMTHATPITAARPR